MHICSQSYSVSSQSLEEIKVYVVDPSAATQQTFLCVQGDARAPGRPTRLPRPIRGRHDRHAQGAQEFMEGEMLDDEPMDLEELMELLEMLEEMDDGLEQFQEQMDRMEGM